MYAALLATERAQVLVNNWLDRHALLYAVLSCIAVTLTLLRPY
jgi:hypothetical protein